jgi:hypothetical protein
MFIRVVPRIAIFFSPKKITQPALPPSMPATTSPFAPSRFLPARTYTRPRLHVGHRQPSRFFAPRSLLVTTAALPRCPGRMTSHTGNLAAGRDLAIGNTVAVRAYRHGRGLQHCFQSAPTDDLAHRKPGGRTRPRALEPGGRTHLPARTRTTALFFSISAPFSIFVEPLAAPSLHQFVLAASYLRSISRWQEAITYQHHRGLPYSLSESTDETDQPPPPCNCLGRQDERQRAAPPLPTDVAPCTCLHDGRVIAKARHGYGTLGRRCLRRCR